MLSPGSMLGPYEVLATVGAGGMGEVFKARDTRLNRIVAIKTSKEQFTDRFEGEARLTAALNHPHIATLYDVGPNYLVMEYVEGVALRGPLSIQQSVRYAKQILEALEAAHRAGITHRDLKPGNILIAKGGIKLLDFGLAQMKQSPLPGTDTATMALSVAGTIAGTLQYMSPEQLQGKAVDARSDIFAFGLVFYEMLTGRPAYEAENSASLISAILTTDPAPLHDQLPGIPPAFERIIQICTAKDPDDRWQSAGDIRRALDVIELPPVAAPAAASSTRARWWYAAAALLLLSVIAVLLVDRTTRSQASEPWKFRPLTYSGRAYNPALSPDGKQVAFLWTGEDNSPMDLYVQLVNGGNPLRLKDTQPRGRAAWSRDGTQIAYQRSDGLYSIPALGGTPRRIVPLSNLINTGNVAWAPAGSFFIVDGRGSGLMTIRDTGEIHALTKPTDAIDSSPAIAPDGSSVAFVRYTSLFNAQLMVMPLTQQGEPGGEPQSLTRAASSIRALDWTREGKEILFENAPGGGNAAIWRISRRGGQAVRVNVPSMLAGDPTTDRQTGRMVFVSGYYEATIFKLPVADAGSRGPQPLIEALGEHRDIGVSPDGSRLAFVSTRTGSKEVWMANADGSNQTQLTSFDGASVGSPRWSPDGTRIAFDGYASGSSDIYIVSTEGGRPTRLTTDSGNEIRPAWSSNGQYIYFGWNHGGTQQIWKIPSAGGKPVQVTRSGGQEAFETPDGQWVYVDNPPNLYRVHPDGGEESQVRTNVYTSFFSVGARHVYVFDARLNQLLRASLGTTVFEPVFTFNDTNRPTCLGPCIALPNDESYAIYRRVTRSTAYLTLIENFR